MAQPLLDLPPRWRLRPPEAPDTPGRIPLIAGPGAGFGDGSHPTTRLCLHALGLMAPEAGFRLLDFGSGTGVLSIAAARLGGNAVGVDIDAVSNRTAIENAGLNGLLDSVTFHDSLDAADGVYEVVIANILCAVLLHFAEDLETRLAPGGRLLLSGLVGTDMPAIVARYGPLVGGERPEIYRQGDWRLVAFKRPG